MKKVPYPVYHKIHTVSSDIKKYIYILSSYRSSTYFYHFFNFILIITLSNAVIRSSLKYSPIEKPVTTN